MIDQIKIEVNGILYAGENNSNFISLPDFTPEAGANYWLNIRSTAGNVFMVPYEPEVYITQEMIPQAGSLTVALCETKEENDFIALSKVFSFQVLSSISSSADTPPTYEQAKSLAEQALAYYEAARTGELRGKSAYEIALDEGFEGDADEWLATLKGPKGDPGEPTDEQAVTAVNAWLTAHPEATTSVQDGAISNAKLAPDGILADVTVLNGKIDNKSNSNNTAFLSTAIGKANLYDPFAAGIVTGYRLNASGANYAAAGYFISDYIPVSAGEKVNVTFSGDSYVRLAFYDEDRNFISPIRYGSGVIAPEDTAYMRFCDVLANQFTAYAYTGDLINLTEAIDSTEKAMKGFASLTDGSYARYDTGVVGTLSGVNLLEFAVFGGEKLIYSYTRTTPDTRGIAFYSASGTFISGAQALSTTQQITVPSGAVTAKASVLTANDVILVDRIKTIQTDLLGLHSEIAATDEKIQRHYYVGANQTYTTIKTAVEAAVQHENSVVHILNGTYDLISEFGSEFFENFAYDSTSTETKANCGLLLGNGIKLIFSPKAAVTCVYEGDNTDVATYFSAFNSYYAGGFTIEGLNIIASGIRYIIHEDLGFFRSGVLEHRAVTIRNCRFTFSNTSATNCSTWRNNGAIGGGLSNAETVLVENCIFETAAHEVGASNVGGAFWHQSGGNAAKSFITVKNCYFLNPQDTFYTYTLGSTTFKTEVLCTGNSMPLAPFNTVADNTSDSIVFKAWNNKIAGSGSTDGKSAYEIAVENGFNGTVAQWLESLHGADGDDGISPHIGQNGNWYIGDTDTGVKAVGTDGEDGEDGVTPNIGNNGHWYIGDVDTGINAIGADGHTPVITTSKSNGVTTVYVDGTAVATINDGVDGQDGDDGITPIVTTTSITGGHNVAFSYGTSDPRNVDFDVMDGASGGENSWTLVNEATINEAVSDISITQDSNGQPFAYDELFIEMTLNRTVTTWANLRFSFINNNYDLVIASSPVNANTAYYCIHAYKARSNIFTEMWASNYQNTNTTSYKTCGTNNANGNDLTKVSINRANGDEYIGAGSTIRVWGR